MPPYACDAKGGDSLARETLKLKLLVYLMEKWERWKVSEKEGWGLVFQLRTRNDSGIVEQEMCHGAAGA